ncbi:VTT domain-containing protein [uncultured Clostridium sp.]|uniref:TVP38/TMEM64 family protein n=1 Tax=uncultured Clostridium sp. TaxID=59620 RepID=UPI0025F961AE|nr:VTT domain-containing protein [uncultured Clostridium sp.]
MLNVDNMTAIFYKYNEIAFIISIVVSIFISLAGILPSVFVTCANIVFFGPIKGFLISLAGETIGGYITFKVYRACIKNTSYHLFNKYSFLEKIHKSSGIKSGVVIFEGRLMPFIPSGLVTLAASLSSVSDLMFITATLAGKIPSILIEAMVSYDFINIKENYMRLFLCILSIILLYITLKNKQK